MKEAVSDKFYGDRMGTVVDPSTSGTAIHMGRHRSKKWNSSEGGQRRRSSCAALDERISSALRREVGRCGFTLLPAVSRCLIQELR